MVRRAGCTGTRPARWCTYLLHSAELNVFYAGSSVDAHRRLLQHNGARSGGAAFTRRGRPWQLVAVFPAANRSVAQALESELKRMSHTEKEALAGMESQRRRRNNSSGGKSHGY